MRNAQFFDDERVKPFDEIDKTGIKGANEKNFVTVEDNTNKFQKSLEKCRKEFKKTCKQSEIFRELFDEILSGKSSYQTYLDDLFFEDGKVKRKNDVYIPRVVYALKKTSIYDTYSAGYYNECVGSRLANYLGFNTVYNLPHRKPRPEFYAYKGESDYDYLLSVDFVPSGYMTESMRGLSAKINECSNVAKWIQEVTRVICENATNPDYNFMVSDDVLYKLQEDLYKMFLFRKLLCQDYDIVDKNILVMFNKETGDFSLAPNLDMEYMFEGSSNMPNYNEICLNTLRFGIQHFPKATEDFISRITHPKARKQIHSIMQDSMVAGETVKNNAEELVCRNISTIQNFYNLLKSNPNSEHESEI